MPQHLDSVGACIEPSVMRDGPAARQEPGFHYASSGLCAFFSFCAALLWASQSAAQSVADFYGRTPVRLIVSADPGGSYDFDHLFAAQTGTAQDAGVDANH